MVQTITPAGHGGRRIGYRVAVTLHTLGAGTSAAAVGVALGALGGALGAPWDRSSWIVVATIAALYALREAVGLPIPLPNLRRQVPEWWRTFFSPSTAALLYGVELGVGFLTYLSFGTFVAVGAAAVASGDPLLGAVVCAPFGIARGLSVAVAGRPDEHRAIDRLERLAAGGTPRAVNAVVLAGICCSALVWL
jgi:hypothetical protein